MKIGILTQPLHHNYGGIIQNWALQQVLRRLGHRPEMIFLTNGSRPNRLLLVKRCLSLVKCLIKKYLLRKLYIYLYSIYDPKYNPTVPHYADYRFVRRICKTKRLTADIDLARLARRRKYEAFVVGSDQVWREEYSPRIQSFFLDFLPNGDARKRIAYAASFGKAQDYISADKMPECRRLLGRFDAVSVREDEGVDIVRNDFGRNQVEKVLDPTLLLDAADYQNLIKLADRHTEPYIASYVLDPSDDKSALLEQISAERKLSVSAIDIEVRPEGMATMSQWLANFADADFVVTDSFHGCVFSIIFGKPFIAIGNAERGLGRFQSLLGELGLNDRLITGLSDYQTRNDKLLATLNYEPVRARIDKLRQSSIQFLTDSLK